MLVVANIAEMPESTLVEFDPAAYGDGCAEFYDQIYPSVELGVVDTLMELAGTRPILELGIGTGRVASALKAAGADVAGVEASPAMIAAFRARADNAGIRLIEGDLTSVSFAGRYGLIYSLVSTFFLLPTLELQAAALRNISEHLADGGFFLSEAYSDATGTAKTISNEYPVNTPSGIRSYTVTTLATPVERLDRMAADAGLELSGRWCDWTRKPYVAASERHISIYRKNA